MIEILRVRTTDEARYVMKTGVEVVKYEKIAKVAFITLNCIDKMKALNAEAVKELRRFMSLL